MTNNKITTIKANSIPTGNSYIAKYVNYCYTYYCGSCRLFCTCAVLTIPFQAP